MFKQNTRGNLIEKISSNVKIIKPKSISLRSWYGKVLLGAFVGLVMIGADQNAEAYSGYPYHYGGIYSGYGYYPIYSHGSDPFIESVEDGDILKVRSFVKNGASVLSLAAD